MEMSIDGACFSNCCALFSFILFVHLAAMKGCCPPSRYSFLLHTHISIATDVKPPTAPVSSTITASTTGLVRPECENRGNQIRLAELFREDAAQANDIFHFVKYGETHSDGSLFNSYVNAMLVIRAQDKTAKNNSSPIEFDILENGQRSFLSAFTRPKVIAEALMAKTGGLWGNTPFDRLWEDFEALKIGRA